MIQNKRCVLVVDDDEKIIRVLKDFLSIKNFHILTATNGDEALNTFSENNTEIDLVLLDVMMPGIDGYSVLYNIRQTSDIPVIMLTAKGQEYDQVKGFEIGADDYIVKPFSPTILIARIEAVLKRSGKSDSGVLSSGSIKVNTTKRTAYHDGDELDLTRREFDLLLYFISNKDITLTREQLLNNVWGYDYSGDIRTVDTHIKQLRNKLKESGSYIKTIHRVGYKFEDNL